jgi:hypothetical protein
MELTPGGGGFPVVKSSVKSNSMAYQMAPICGNCGEKPAETLWEIGKHIREKESFGDSLVRSAKPAIIREMPPTKNLSFDVGICNECGRLLKKEKVRRELVQAALIMPAALALLGIPFLMRNWSQFNVTPVTLGVMAVTGVILLAIMFVATAGEPLGWRSDDGRYFRFRNKVYDQAFVQLNPGRIKPRK